MKNVECMVRMLEEAGDEKSLRSAIDWGLSLAGPSVIEAFIDVEPYSLTVFD